MTSSQTGIKMQNLLSEPFFQEIMNDLEDPVNEETLDKQQRKYRALKNDLYVFFHEGKQTLLKQIQEMTSLLEERRQFRQMVIDYARKDPKKVRHERNFMKLLLDEIDDVNQQIDLGYMSPGFFSSYLVLFWTFLVPIWSFFGPIVAPWD